MSSSSSKAIIESLDETYKKVVSSLLPSIEEHMTAEEYDAKKDSLDFLSAKNSLLLSYLIDLVQMIRLVEKRKVLLRKQRSEQESKDESKGDDSSEGSNSSGDSSDDNDDEDEATAKAKVKKGKSASLSELTEQLHECVARLDEMKVALDKVRPLEKKMRYQIDRLLAAAGDATSFAAGGEKDDSDDEDEDGEGDGGENDDDGTGAGNTDPLSFRPNLQMMASDNDEDEDDNDEEASDGQSSDEQVDDSDDDDDEDLRAAKAVARAGSSQTKKKGKRIDYDDDNDSEGKSAVYQAPRFTAVPFAEKEKAEEKAERALARQRRRMRQSELLQTLRAADGTDRPEEDDLDGGAALGKQRETARKMAEKDAERSKFEEDFMVRLTQSRKDKKAKQRMMREEQSNLGAIADLGRLTAGVADAFGGDDEGSDDGFGRGARMSFGGDSGGGRHDNGKRKRVSDEYAEINGEQRRRKKSSLKGSNAMQRALYGTEGKSKKKKKSRGGR